MAAPPKSVRRPRQDVDHALAQDIKTKNPDAKRPGRKKGDPKPPGSGSVKGQKTRTTIDREKQISDALMALFSKLTKDDLENITPLKIMELCTLSAASVGHWNLTLLAAEKWAPYVHAKLQKVVHYAGEGNGDGMDDDENDNTAIRNGGGTSVRIIGGLPDTKPVVDAEVVAETPPKKR